MSCSDTDRLNTPSGAFIEYETLTLRWGEVQGAKTYTVRITDGESTSETSVSKNYYSLEELSRGEYEITVTAKGTLADSLPSETVKFEREAEVGLEYKLVGNTYEVSSVGTASGVVEIPATYRKKPVTAIGEKAFFGCSDITEIKLPDGIRSIGSFAFANCSYLTKINLPEGLSSMGESTFSGCRALGKSITVPNSLREIPNNAFAYCSGIEEITFGEGVVSIGENAFTDCSKIKSLVFPEGLKSIGRFAFAACADVSSVSLPEGLEVMDEFAFSKAISLTSVTLPDSLKSIGKGAFYYCSSLATVELGSGVEEIGDSAFLDSAVYNSAEGNEIYLGGWFLGLKDATASSVEIKDGTVGIANNAFYGNKSLSSITLPNSVKYIGMHAFAASDIVSIVTGSGVKKISDQAFLYCEKLVDVALGSFDYVNKVIADSSLEYIGTYAFMNCTRLERIEIPDTVKDIGAYAFRNTEIYNSALTGAVYADNWVVDFNETVTEDVVIDSITVGIARYAFYNCTTLKSVKIGSNVKYIGKGAFYNCVALEKVNFPDTLEVIGDYAFYSCTSLKLTKLPPMLREIGRAAFYQCGTADNYTDDTDTDVLEIPAGVTHIGDFAFYGCGYRDANAVGGVTRSAGIDIIVIGGNVEYIGKCAFRGFASLKSVTVGGTLMIGDKAFYGCPSLESVAVSGEITNIGDKAFYKCTSLKTATFPDTLKSVGKHAFSGCTSLTKVELGKGLESIGDGAFYKNSALKSLYTSPTLTSVGSEAFRGCTSLTSLVIGASVKSIGAHAFYGCDVLTLYVEDGTESFEWSKNYNSTFVPVVFGCEIEDGYAVSVTVGDSTFANAFSDTVIGAPYREGYVFGGWSTEESDSLAEYSADGITSAEDGLRLYAVWTEATPENDTVN